MGLGIVPVFNPRTPEASFDQEGKVLLRESENLDDIALSCNIRAFTSFADNRETPEGFEGDPSQLEDILGPWTDWFSPEEGLKVIECLIHMLRSDRKATKMVEEPEYVLVELEEIQRCLEVAARKGASFRFEVL